MATSKQDPVRVERAAEHLITYAFEKEGIRNILSLIPASEEINPVGLEYEIQLLKIITVGWGISFFMENRKEKQALSVSFWNGVQAFCQNIDSVTALMIPASIDYFQTIHQRLETYLEALQQQSEATDPAMVFGPAYARCCHQADNIHVIMAGNRVFTGALQAVREYLADLVLEPA